LPVIVDQQRDVADPLAQRRDADANDVQPEVQVLAEIARGDVRLQVAVGGGNQPDADAGM
jgi:hypothetical protein